MYSKQGVYSNKDPLVSEVIALPAVPQPPPFKNVLLSWSLKSLFLSDRFENIVCSIRKLKLNFWLKIDWKDVKLFSINTPSYFQVWTKAERSFDWVQCFKALQLVHISLSSDLSITFTCKLYRYSFKWRSSLLENINNYLTYPLGGSLLEDAPKVDIITNLKYIKSKSSGFNLSQL